MLRGWTIPMALNTEDYRRIADPQIRPITTGSDASDG
jgi:hypothetical protein